MPKTIKPTESAIYLAALAFRKGEQAVEALASQFAGKTRDEVAEATREDFARAYDVTLTVQGSGRKVWPAEADSTKRAHNRFVLRIMGETKPKDREEIEVPPHIAKLAAALVKACNEYEQARKLASTAIAEAFSA
jgi:hypothetical protein